MAKPKVFNESGKRKSAIARATVKKGKGRIRINKHPLEIHEPDLARLKITEPLLIAEDRTKNLDIDVNVSGGGVMGQADAARTAIARACRAAAGAAESASTSTSAFKSCAPNADWCANPHRLSASSPHWSTPG
jgi:ribosomal protein S9